MEVKIPILQQLLLITLKVAVEAVEPEALDLMLSMALVLVVMVVEEKVVRDILLL